MNTITTATVTIAAASATFTPSSIADNNTVTIGDITYTFKDTLSTGPTVAYEVKRHSTTLATSLANLALAINGGTGIGTNYSTGTVAHTEVEAVASADHIHIASIIAGRSGAGVSLATSASGTGWGAAAMSGGSITIVANTDDVTFSQPSQQVTVGEFPADNPDWSRALRLTDAGIFCMRYGATAVAMLTSVWSQIALAMDTGLTWEPYISTEPVDASTTASGDDVTLSLVAVTELTSLTYQWQYYDTSWTNITVSNAADINKFLATNYDTAAMTLNPDTGAETTNFRCIVTDNLGQSTTSSEATVTITA